jgi:hypothetical protein
MLGIPDKTPFFLLLRVRGANRGSLNGWNGPAVFRQNVLNGAKRLNGLNVLNPGAKFRQIS